jgi:hypothetical protein
LHQAVAARQEFLCRSRYSCRDQYRWPHSCNLHCCSREEPVHLWHRAGYNLGSSTLSRPARASCVKGVMVGSPRRGLAAPGHTQSIVPSKLK